ADGQRLVLAGYRDGNLPACEEGRLLPRHRRQVGLGQHGHDAVALQGLHQHIDADGTETAAPAAPLVDRAEGEEAGAEGEIPVYAEHGEVVARDLGEPDTDVDLLGSGDG